MGRRLAVSVILIVVFLAVGAGIFKLLFDRRIQPREGETARPWLVVRVETARRVTHPEWLAGYGQARALRAFINVSCVVNVLLSTTNNVDSGVTPRSVSARWVPSTLDTKCARIPGCQ